ncbi:hypothetical protein AB4560_09375 [Vibrio sp. 10N.222.51.C12]|uniref:hypothetical protein n=1 Tax=Vibrio sp. 10N.222.51.C12 TaxID=3229622 RepID=UPI00354B5597
MSEGQSEPKFAKDCLVFKQGQDSLLGVSDSIGEGVEKIRTSLSKLLVKVVNMHFTY